MLAGFLGYHVIRGIPPLLHTPLMSATNAMSGISLVGSLLVAGAGHGPLSTAFGFVAVACSSTNVVGGFLITDRMLRMFKKEEDRLKKGTGRRRGLLVAGVLAALLLAAGYSFTLRGELGRAEWTSLLRYSYILSAVLFILGLKGLSHP